MQFTELMMLYTTPLYWEPSASFHARQLKEFLLYLLDPEKPGYGVLLDESTSYWHEDDAIQWIEDTYEVGMAAGSERARSCRRCGKRERFPHLSPTQSRGVPQ